MQTNGLIFFYSVDYLWDEVLFHCLECSVWIESDICHEVFKFPRAMFLISNSLMEVCK